MAEVQALEEREWKVGDKVIALAVGGLASFVTVGANQVVRLLSYALCVQSVMQLIPLLLQKRISTINNQRIRCIEYNMSSM